MSNNIGDLIVNGNRLLKLYSYYSLGISLIIMVLHSIDPDGTLIGHEAITASLIATILYVIVAASFVAIAALSPNVQQATSYFFLETALLTVLMFSSGGLDTGFSSLILVSVVVANLIAPGLLGFAVAAWTTLATLLIQHLLPERYDSGQLLNSGMFGFICFLLAGLTQALSRKLNSALELATSQTSYLRKLRNISWQALADLPNGLIACDRHDQIIFHNQKAREWFNLQNGDPLPDALRELFSGPEGRRLIQTTDVRLQAKKMPLAGSEADDYLIYMEDQTQLASAAQQLKLASLGRLTASIAHEIRNPLSALRQASQLLAETDYLKDDELYLCQVIEQHCLRINRTVEDILQLSRKRQPVTEQMRLRPWLDHFREQFDGLNRDKDYHLLIYCDDDLLCSVDPDHLQQILHNLCANGLRYALKQHPNDARLVISAELLDGKRIQLDVMDNGSGIDDEQAEHLFEPFFTTEHNGTGLGLYLCRELAEANRASIQYLRIPTGSCFRLMLNMENTA
ncbi:sensor histidine kinase [Oceanobacter mangrovi]|uniref:sensor histidine kinase n=1 Tax=Oceanobacter mangrovi TaxID=2862510 RepID=UPI001C8D8472|nr:HAMP domain-containing sensor histidine kinase [Oceanobacter mangrovi]